MNLLSIAFTLMINAFRQNPWRGGILGAKSHFNEELRKVAYEHPSRANSKPSQVFIWVMGSLGGDQQKTSLDNPSIFKTPSGRYKSKRTVS